MAKPKSILLGLLAALSVLYVRDLTRAAFGVPNALPTLADFLIGSIWLSGEMVVLTVAFNQSMRRGHGPKRAALIGLLVAGAMSAMGDAIYVAIRHRFPSWGLLPPDAGEPDTAMYSFVTGFVDSGLVLALWTLAFLYPTALREAFERASEARHLRREMELYRLRTTLEPHFVLNTLNAISGVMTEEPETARQLVGDLGTLLRDLVRKSDDRERTLGEELEWLERYTAILETRHPGRLAFEWDVDPALRAHRVPALVLQPLVENAVQHGALRRRSNGRIRLSARSEKEQLVVTIEDNGPGLPSEAPRDGARGLEMVRRRLALESPDATLQLESTHGGTRATLTFA
ncbi:sensor histidine kinase [Pendulispora albinea]|uniref:Histidine kinase n=1 Tax=Pendulispora albinea TaxID=2741071 RepID=A0ABZ2M1T4_9BACT